MTIKDDIKITENYLSLSSGKTAVAFLILLEVLEAWQKTSNDEEMGVK